MAKADEIYIHPHHKWWGYETHFIIPRQLVARLFNPHGSWKLEV
jgi:hypothetical protein